MIDFTGLSYKDAQNILKLMGVNYKLEGYGYAVKQNIEDKSKIDKEVVIEFKGLY